MTQNFPTQADVVVIGGGIIGCSTAYHLAKDHKLNVVLLERNCPTSPAACHVDPDVSLFCSSKTTFSLWSFAR